MRDITFKKKTLRNATAMGVVFCSQQTIDRIQSGQIEKGNPFEFARAAGFLGAKNTQHLLPHCHPVSIDAMELTFESIDRGNSAHMAAIGENSSGKSGILIMGTASSIGRTGIEMEILTGISIAALEIYDMLKPIDKEIEISHIRLIEKKGGKSDPAQANGRGLTCAILVCSDRVASGEKEDQSGMVLKDMAGQQQLSVVDYRVVPDEKTVIKQALRQWIDEKVSFIFTTGGTGLSPRDVTVEAVKELITKEAPGIVEEMRAFGGVRTPTAMLSRAVAGSASSSMLITLPGSVKGVRESLQAIFPALFHSAAMLAGEGHHS